MIRTEVTVKTLCTKCGAELRDFYDFTEHRRQHHLEYCWQNYPRIMEDLKAAGFKDKPDPWNRRPTST